MEDEQSQPGESPETWPALGSALDEREGPAATEDNLRGILVRHTRRRRRWTTGIAATVVALGVGGGAAIGGVVASTGGQLAATSLGATSTTVHPPLGLSAPRAASNSTGSGSTGGVHVYNGEAPVSSGGVSGASSTASSVPAKTKTPSALCPANGCPYSGPMFGPYGALKKLFTRTTNGVTIRAFTLSSAFGYPYPIYPAVGGTVQGGTAFGSGGGSSSSGGGSSSSGGAPASAGSATASTGSATSGSTVSGSTATHAASPPLPMPACMATQQLLVEVSNSGAVGQFEVPSPAKVSSTVAYVDDQVIGSAEGSPIAVVAVRVGSGATTVEARFGTGTYDAMTVNHGWAVLATSLGSSANVSKDAAVHVAVLNSSNKQISDVNISEAPSYAVPNLCILPTHPRMLPPSSGPNMPVGAPSGPPTSIKVPTSGNKTSKSK